MMTSLSLLCFILFNGYLMLLHNHSGQEPDVPILKASELHANITASSSNQVDKSASLSKDLPVYTSPTSIQKGDETSISQDRSHFSSPSSQSVKIHTGTMTWEAFSDIASPDLRQFVSILRHDDTNGDDPLLLAKAIDEFDPVMCSDNVSEDLKRPRLSTAEFDWCRWALRADGGQVVVGKSWGRLTNKADQTRFDRNNCNAVRSGKNPSCDDSWGDIHVRNWAKNRMSSLLCDPARQSKIDCYLNDNADKYCSISNAQISFQQYSKISRGSHTTPSKKFERDFLSADCSSSPAVQSQVPFHHLFSTTAVASRHCDVVYNGTLLLFSHDDIR